MSDVPMAARTMHQDLVARIHALEEALVRSQEEVDARTRDVERCAKRNAWLQDELRKARP